MFDVGFGAYILHKICDYYNYSKMMIKLLIVSFFVLGTLC